MNLDKPLLPGQVIGIIGGGHLAKMMALSAREMGFRVGVLDPIIDGIANNDSHLMQRLLVRLIFKKQLMALVIRVS